MKTKIDMVEHVMSEINYAKNHIDQCIGTGSNDHMLDLALSELQESIKFLNIIKKELKDSE